MFALIDPTASVQYISSWENPVDPSTQYTPVYTYLGQRVAWVEQTQFPVADPLFWYPCADDVVAGRFYFDPLNSVIISIPAGMPNPAVPKRAVPLSDGVPAENPPA